MALPKKGIRKIMVGNIRYYWTVRLDYQMMKYVVGIGKVASPNDHVAFFCDFGDSWLAAGGSTYFPSITPGLIRRAILFADTSGKIKWNGKKESYFTFAKYTFSELTDRVTLLQSFK